MTWIYIVSEIFYISLFFLMRFFKGSIIFTIIAIVLWFTLWLGQDRNIMNWLQTVFIVVILWVLEISLSFDNAVVNANILKKMDEKWQHRFLTWWMAIAVFGMRVIFPLLIVSIVGHIGIFQTLQLAIFDQNAYAHILESTKVVIAGFGWAFLFMVALKFFFDIEKENHRIWPVEKFLKKIWQLASVEIVVALLTLLFVSKFLPAGEMMWFLTAGVWWIIIFVLIEWLTGLLNKPTDTMKNVARVWLSLFLYLEVLDASFSFDGVIWAFALSKNIFIIALWLGVGAMFVRSLTIMLVRKWTLAKYRYLEHGAFWAILALAVIMFLNTTHEVPEVVTGLIGMAFIGVALVSSVRANRKGLVEK